MSRVPSLSSPFLLGFDEIERVLDRVSKAADGYPPTSRRTSNGRAGRPASYSKGLILILQTNKNPGT
jgi:hypothetical protein